RRSSAAFGTIVAAPAPLKAAFTARRSRVSTSLSATSCFWISGANIWNTARDCAVGGASIPPTTELSALIRSTSLGGKLSGSWNDRLRTWYSSPSIAPSRSVRVCASAPNRAESDAGAAFNRSSSCTRTFRIVMTAVVTALKVSPSRCRNANCARNSAGVTLERRTTLSANRTTYVLPAREAADQPARRVEDVEPHVLVLALEPVVDHRAARWVLPDGVYVRAAAERATAPVRAIGVTRLEQVHALARDHAPQLAQRRDIVQNPERASVRRRDEVALLDREIVHRHDREVESERLPVRPVIERHPHAPLAAREQQAAACRVFAHHTHQLGRGDALHDPGPGAPV